MRNFKVILGALFVLLMLSSCEDDEAIPITNSTSITIDEVIPINNSTDTEGRFSKKINPTLIFGRFYGKCIGNSCIEIFKLNKGVLYEDVVDMYPVSTSFYEGKFLKVKDSDKIDTEHLMRTFPKSLLVTLDQFHVIGTPDAGDWGGIYLQYQDDRVQIQWLVDLKTENIPKELRTYILNVDKTVDKIGMLDNLN